MKGSKKTIDWEKKVKQEKCMKEGRQADRQTVGRLGWSLDEDS